MASEYVPNQPAVTVSELGMRVGEMVRRSRITGDTDSRGIEIELTKMGHTQSETVADAMAFAALGRQVLISALAHFADGSQDAEAALLDASHALGLLTRSVDTLEAVTGIAAESFTGEDILAAN